MRLVAMHGLEAALGLPLRAGQCRTSKWILDGSLRRSCMKLFRNVNGVRSIGVTGEELGVTGEGLGVMGEGLAK